MCGEQKEKQIVGDLNPVVGKTIEISKEQSMERGGKADFMSSISIKMKVQGNF